MAEQNAQQAWRQPGAAVSGMISCVALAASGRYLLPDRNRPGSNRAEG